MGPFILATIVIALCSYGFYVLNVAYKKKTVEDRVSFLLGPHAALEKEAATMQAAKKLLLEEVVKLYGNNFQEFPGREHLHADEFTSLLAARFDEYVIKRVLKVFGTSKEIRIYTLKKGGKSISIAVGMIPAEELIYEYTFYVPLNGYEMKTKEINEIIEMSRIRETETHAFFDVHQGMLRTRVYDWSKYLKDAENNPIQARVAQNGKFGKMLLGELIETLRIKLFVDDKQHVGIFGSSGTGKTSFWRAWVEALRPILPDEYRIIFLTAVQFKEWLENYESWDWFHEELSKNVKSVIIVDDIPQLNADHWSILLSLMDGKLQDELNVSLMLIWQAESKDALIKDIGNETIAQSIIRRMGWMLELRPYNEKEWEQRVTKIKEMISSPEYYDVKSAKEILSVNTALSSASNIAPSEVFLSIKRGTPKDATEEKTEPKSEPKSEVKSTEPTKIIRRL